MEHSKLGGHKPLPDRLFSSYEQLPATRFVILRAWERWSEHADRKRLKHVQAFVAEDMSPALGWKRPAQVVLTCVSKTSVTPAQVDHTRQLLQLLPRRLGFQSLVGVFDSDSSWVFVQEFDPTALWLSDVFLQATFSEDKLRKIVFQLAAMLHFLHAHRLSLAGQLYLHDLVQTSATKKVILLLSPCLVFSGCTLVLATKRNKDTDM
ncbi:TPA: hypothetical protein N0F65_006409 [Lagenidium giganteum]|uniref:Protein kinase domain-containing protein n=1 Tax=Lagenidium giganteum TaxID=4803 RepID=A0AAV2Z499_9STRA|nr:TPA: hypothetical protein N0F65_006409 [Lagenidium giganteum]